MATDRKIFIAISMVFLLLGLLNIVRIRTKPGPSAPSFSADTSNNYKASSYKKVPNDGEYGIHLPKKQPQLKAGLVPVLMYHHVGELPVFADAIRRDLTVSVKDFSEQIALLDKEGYQTITTPQLNLALAGKAALPSKPVVITFDDGYQDVFQNAVPILKEHKMFGAFVIITGFVGRAGYVDWPTLAQAQKAGMELYCHSEHHMDFTNRLYTYDMKNSEIANCKQALQENLGVISKTFVYPYGHFDATIENILRNNGFDLAFTTQFGIVDKGDALLELPRLRVHGQEFLETYRNNLLGIPEDQIRASRSKPDKSL